MFKLFIASLLYLIPFNHCFSQDMIIQRSTDEIPAKVIEVTTTEIKYKRLDNLEGPTFIIPKSDVFMIRYANGTNDIFYADNPGTETASESSPLPEPKTEQVIPIPSSSDLHRQGVSDATRYYQGYKAASTATLLVGLLSPVVGLIPALSCSATPPAEKNLNYPNQELMNKTEYYDAYTRQSRKIKQGKVWTNLGIAFGVNVAAILILFSGQ